MSYTRPTASPTAGSNHVPTACYRVLVTSINNTPSARTGSAMTTLGVQILSPATAVGKDGVTYDTAGKDGQLRIVFSDKNLANCFNFLTLTGCPLPAQASSQEEDIKNIQAAMEKYFTGGMTFEMVVSSKRDVVVGPTGEILKDSAGREILGSERADFGMFNVVGLAKPVGELAGGANPTRPY